MILLVQKIFFRIFTVRYYVTRIWYCYEIRPYLAAKFGRFFTPSLPLCPHILAFYRQKLTVASAFGRLSPVGVDVLYGWPLSLSFIRAQPSPVFGSLVLRTEDKYPYLSDAYRKLKNFSGGYIRLPVGVVLWYIITIVYTRLPNRSI